MTEETRLRRLSAAYNRDQDSIRFVLQFDDHLFVQDVPVEAFLDSHADAGVQLSPVNAVEFEGLVSVETFYLPAEGFSLFLRISRRGMGWDIRTTEAALLAASVEMNRIDLSELEEPIGEPPPFVH